MIVFHLNFESDNIKNFVVLMLKCYQAFITMVNQKKSITDNKIFDDLIYSYNFYFINNNQDINWIQNKDKIIFIDQYVNPSQNENYFIICFSNTLFIIPQSDLLQMSSFFSSSTDSTIFCLSKNIQNELKQTFSLIKLNIYQNDHYILDECILNLLEHISIKNRNVLKFWEMIKKCLCSFLIQKSFNNSNVNRLKNYELFFVQEKPIETKDYQLNIIQIRCLGITATSKVDLVYNIKQEKLYVVKTVISLFDQKYEIRESKAYSNIYHPFIPKYFGEIIDMNQNKIIIEYINGKTLENLNQLNLNENDKINIIFELLIAIQYLHSKQYKYRDLKPNNIIIDENKTVVIIDFDRMIANVNDESTTSFPHDFCAPEITSNQFFTEKCDIYSVGFIIKYIMTGKKPKQNVEWNKMNTNLSIYTINKIEQIIKKCTDINPQKRPSIIRLLNEFYLIFLSDNKLRLLPEILDIYKKNVININYDQSIFQKQFLCQKYTNIDIIVYPENIENILNNYHIATYDDPSFCFFILGFLFFKGIIVQKNIQKSLLYYRLGAMYDDSDSLLNVGLIYFYVYDYRDLGAYYIKCSSNRNNPKANFFIGIILYDLRHTEDYIIRVIYYFEQAAKQNYPDALFCLGDIYYRGVGIKKDIQKGIKYFQQAAELHQPNALCQLGNIYLYGKNVTQNITKGIYYYTLAEEQNIPDAIYALGKMYCSNDFGRRNDTLAIKYLVKAANQKIDLNTSTKAKYDLVLFILQNQNYFHNKNLFINYLTQAADSNIAEAQSLLGFMYLQGTDIKCDYNKAFHYLNLSALQNNSTSQFFLGLMYFDGLYVKKDTDKARYYLELSAKQNNSYAQYILGLIYALGLGVPPDISRAIYFSEQAAEQNHPNALFLLGDIYFRGELIKNGVKKDIQKGIKYFQCAADLNQPNALCQLGYLYLYGIGVKQDSKKGIFYYKKAAERNEPEAMNALGNFYSKKDDKKAIDYYSMAIDQQFDIESSYRAQYNLGLLFLQTKSNFQNINKSIYHLKKASEGEILDAHLLLGFIYYEGIIIQRDVKKAIYYLKNASSLNDNYAKNNLGVIYKIGDNVEKNIYNSLIFFNESIKMKNDPVASFNFIQTKFFEFKGLFDYEESLKLLCQTSKKRIPYSMDLLCLIIINKHKKVTLETIKNDFAQIEIKIKSYVNNKNKRIDEFNRLIDYNSNIDYINFSNEIYNKIKLYNMEYPNVYIQFFNKLKNINLIYGYSFGITPINMLQKINKKSTNDNPPNIKENINQQFYEGFGL